MLAAGPNELVHKGVDQVCTPVLQLFGTVGMTCGSFSCRMWFVQFTAALGGAWTVEDNPFGVSSEVAVLGVLPCYEVEMFPSEGKRHRCDRHCRKLARANPGSALPQHSKAPAAPIGRCRGC